MQRTAQDRIFVGLDRVVNSEYRGKRIDVTVIGSVIAAYFGQCAVELSPADRILLLAEVVDRILQVFNDRHNNDLYVN